MSKTAVDLQIEALAEDNDVDIKTAADMYLKQSEYVQDLDKLPVVKHNWIKRGVKVSCEGANHPHHSHFLRRK